MVLLLLGETFEQFKAAKKCEKCSSYGSDLIGIFNDRLKKVCDKIQ